MTEGQSIQPKLKTFSCRLLRFSVSVVSLSFEELGWLGRLRQKES